MQVRDFRLSDVATAGRNKKFHYNVSQQLSKPVDLTLSLLKTTF